MTLVLVMLGAAVGAPSRWLLDQAIQTRRESAFPLGTWTINVTGSLLLGVVLGAAAFGPAIARARTPCAGTGFCGGFTTYSTFGFETVRLAEDGSSSKQGSTSPRASSSAWLPPSPVRTSPGSSGPSVGSMTDEPTTYFETRRLLARSFAAGDVEAFVAYRADPDVARYQGWSDFTPERGTAFVESLAGASARRTRRVVPVRTRGAVGRCTRGGPCAEGRRRRAS